MLIALIFRGGYNNTMQKSFMLQSTHYQLFGDYCYKLHIPFTKDDAALAYNIMVMADGQHTKCKHLKCITKDALCDIADKSNFDYIDTADLIQKLTNKKISLSENDDIVSYPWFTCIITDTNDMVYIEFNTSIYQLFFDISIRYSLYDCISAQGYTSIVDIFWLSIIYMDLAHNSAENNHNLTVKFDINDFMAGLFEDNEVNEFTKQNFYNMVLVPSVISINQMGHISISNYNLCNDDIVMDIHYDDVLIKYIMNIPYIDYTLNSSKYLYDAEYEELQTELAKRITYLYETKKQL